jgi:uridylate kinase
MKCDALFKGTSVDGVYDADPKKVPTAKRYETVSYDTVLADNLKVMDASAVALVPRQQYSDRRVQHPRAGQPCLGPAGEGVSTIVQNEGE